MPNPYDGLRSLRTTYRSERLPAVRTVTDAVPLLSTHPCVDPDTPVYGIMTMRDGVTSLAATLRHEMLATFAGFD